MLPGISIPATIVAAVSAFVLGGAWYSPLLFGSAWRRAAGLDEETLARRKLPLVFGLSFLWSAVMAVDLAFFLSGERGGALWGLTAGLLAGVGWAAAGIWIVGLFEKRPPAWMLINSGYLAASLALMGVILGAWR
jgi:hypothetical protein